MAAASIRLTRALLDRITDQAQAAYPEECCGLLVGRHDGDDVCVSRVLPSRNLAPDRRRAFEIDPTLHLRAMREARPAGETIVGHYHSHPDGAAAPSRRDRATAADLPHLWLIVAVSRGGIDGCAVFAPDASGTLRPVPLALAD